MLKRKCKTCNNSAYVYLWFWYQFSYSDKLCLGVDRIALEASTIANSVNWISWYNASSFSEHWN